MDDDYKNKIRALNKSIEKQQKMMKQMTSVITPVINTSCLNIQNYSNIMQNTVESLVEYQKALTKKYNNISNISQSLQSFTKIADHYQNYDFKGALIGIEEISNIIDKKIDYLSISKTLDNNIKIINSIFNNLYNDNLEEINEEEANEILSKAQNIEFNIPFPEDTSIAEMEATINGEEYKETKMKYFIPPVLFEMMSFVKNPVKAMEVLNQFLLFGNKSMTPELKSIIYQKIADEIGSLIIHEMFVIAFHLILFFLGIFLYDNVLYQRFIEYINKNKH